MGAHCERCDSLLSGSREAVETVDAGVLCRACFNEIDAEPLPDVTEPGSYQINEDLGGATNSGEDAGLLPAVEAQGWIVFAVGSVAMVAVSLWQAFPDSGGWAALWAQSGGSLVVGVAVGIVLWAAVCAVMFLD